MNASASGSPLDRWMTVDTPAPTPNDPSRTTSPPSTLALMVSPRIARGAIKVSLVVGTVLNVVNNGEQLWVHHSASPLGVALNYFVPFCVSAYSAARNERQRVAGPRHGPDA